MKRLFLLMLLILPVASYAGTVSLPFTDHMNSMSNWSLYLDGEIVSDSSSPDPSGVLRFTYPKGFGDGHNPGSASVYYNPASEIYFQYYFKYSAGYQFHPYEDKQVFIWNDDEKNNFYVGTRYGEFEVCLQGDGTVYQSSGWSISDNRWYSVTVHAKLNTGTSSNGVIQVWIDDKLVIDKSNVKFMSNPTPWHNFRFTPIWGGYSGETKSQTDYSYFDLVRISTSPIGPAPPSAAPAPAPPSGLRIIN